MTRRPAVFWVAGRAMAFPVAGRAGIAHPNRPNPLCLFFFTLSCFSSHTAIRQQCADVGAIIFLQLWRWAPFHDVPCTYGLNHVQCHSFAAHIVLCPRFGWGKMKPEGYIAWKYKISRPANHSFCRKLLTFFDRPISYHIVGYTSHDISMIFPCCPICAIYHRQFIWIYKTYICNHMYIYIFIVPCYCQKEHRCMVLHLRWKDNPWRKTQKLQDPVSQDWWRERRERRDRREPRRYGILWGWGDGKINPFWATRARMLEVEFPNHMIVELWLCQFCQWLLVVRAQGSKGVGGYEMPHGYYPLVIKHRYGKFFILFDDYGQWWFYSSQTVKWPEGI